MEEITIKELKKFLKSNYIKSGWFDNIKDEIFTEKHEYRIKKDKKIIKKESNILECMNNCTSPTGEDSEERLKAIFRAFSLFPMDKTRILILGKDPYPSKGKNAGRAHGLAFSFAEKEGKNVSANDSLLNIFKAIKSYNKYDKHDIKEWKTNLEIWATTNKVLLLNTALTYESDKQKKHQAVWKTFIKNTIIKLLTCNSDKLVVFLWGTDAQNLFFECINSFGINNCDYNLANKTVSNKHETINITRRVLCLATSHPSNTGEAVNKGFSEDAPNHFKACDEFLGKNEEDKKYTWLDFPENNQKNT